MSAAHTPGPWQACGYGDYGDYGGRCCIVIGDDGTTRIAAVMGHQEEAEADARLIAAAPDLLEALKVARQFMSIASDWNIDEAEINGEMRSTYDWIEVLDTAIATATGGAA